MGIMVTYGSYVPKSENLAKSAGWICALDTLVAVMAALAMVGLAQGQHGGASKGGGAHASKGEAARGIFRGIRPVQGRRSAGKG